MSWLNELRDEIKLTSPDGEIFYAKWRRNDRSFQKKLGIFSPPKFKGDIVQDLNVTSDLYPLNIFFDGPFNNTESENFFQACKQTGKWEIVHPAKGPIILQLVSCKEIIDPVESGNVTEFETQWIEPANIERKVSVAEEIETIKNKALGAIDSAQIILQQLKTDAYSLVQSSLNTFNKITGAMDKIFKEVTSIESLAKDSYDAARASLNGFLAAYGIADPDPADIGEALTNLAIASVNSSDDFNTRHTTMVSFIDEIFLAVPATTTPDDYNKITGIEFAVSIALIMIAQIVATSKFASRADVVSAMENIINIFNSVVAQIEESQEAFSGKDIDFQYFSQIPTYSALISLYSTTMNYLISQFYNLVVERRFYTKTPRSPIEITCTEYGSMGENDSNYDLFISSNHLSGNDILLLPAGREVVIYI